MVNDPTALWASGRDSAEEQGEGEWLDITKMSLEELEALPELGECTGGEVDRPPMVCRCPAATCCFRK